MTKLNHTCAVCGKKYYACRDCDKRQTWLSKCDTHQHWQVYQVLIMLTRDEISAKDAHEKLSYIGVEYEDIDTYTNENAEILRKIYDEAYVMSRDEQSRLVGDSNAKNVRVRKLKAEMNEVTLN